jgi:hypothetical protein
MTRIRSYHELLNLETFEDRFAYLRLDGVVGDATFGSKRHINQSFYTSREWKRVRDLVVVRDNGCDLGVHGYEINGALLIHHINPISVDDIVHSHDWVMDPNNLITTTKATHNAIHYGDSSLLRVPYKERSSGDTRLW